MSSDPSLRPLRVTAHLQAGIVHSHAWGIALDGLLASQLHAQATAEELDAGAVPVPVMELDDVEDLELPLARCQAFGQGDDWHWAATCAWPEPAGPDQQDPNAAAEVAEALDVGDFEVRTWYSFPDHDILERLTPALPLHVDDERGRWRRYAMPQLVTMTPALTWRAVGDVDAVRALLEPVRAIGKSRARGEGAVLRSLALGAHHGPSGVEPVVADWRVVRLGSGRFTATGPMYGGNRMDLGPMALLRPVTAPGVSVAVSSRRLQAADRAILAHLGVDPARQGILALKSSVHFRADFEPLADEVLVVAAPGANIADPGLLPFRRLPAGMRRRPGVHSLV